MPWRFVRPATAGGATREPASPGNSANLDFLRTMAVLMVLVDHLTLHYGVHFFVPLGEFGVLLFFVHTSVVLMYSMKRSGLTGPALFRDFYIRRFFRIYPLSILSVLIVFALSLHPESCGLALGLRPGFPTVISNLLLIQNLTQSRSMLGPLWSLPLEVQMYLVLPFLFLWKRRSLPYLLLLWAVCGLLGHLPQTIPALGWFSLLLYVPNFLPGVIAFTISGKKVIPGYLWPLFIMAMAAVFVCLPSRRIGAELCLLLGLLIPRFKELTFSPLNVICGRIATYSYGIYLGHTFFIWFALTRHRNWPLFWIMWLIIPCIVYHCFEHPAIEVGRWMARRLTASSTPAAPPMVLMTETSS